MLHRLFFGIALLAILVIGTPVFAAVDSADILIKLLVEKGIISEEEAESVRAEVATIRQEEEAAKKSSPVTGKRPIKVSGYLQERYIHSEQKDFNDSLEARRIRLALSGDATPEVDYKIQVDFAGSRKGLTEAILQPGEDLDDTTMKTRSGAFSKPTLLDAVIGYKLNDTAKLSVGQFKIPFSVENLTSSANLDLINRSQVVETLVPGRDNGAQGRDIGVQLSGLKSFNEEETKQLEYYLGLFNGAGINVGDDNDRKDLAARLVYRPGIEGLALGASHYAGAATVDKIDHFNTGAEVVYLKDPWALKGEYITARDNTTNRNGWYTTLVRQFTPNVQGAVRFERLEPNTEISGNVIKTFTAGVNYFFNKDGSTRLQLNYIRPREEGRQIENDQVQLQFQASY